MAWKTIEKPRAFATAPNLVDYRAAREAFSWAQARGALDGLPGGRGLNIAYEAVDRHAAGPRGTRLALRWLGRRGETRDFTYAGLCAQTNRFANVLQGLGVGRGERVFVLAGRIPELYISALGALKGGHVFCPLFSAFGPEPIRQRIALGDGRVLVTTAALFKRKVAEIRSSLPGLKHVLLIGEPDEVGALPGTYDLRQLMAQAGDGFDIVPTQPEDLALLHFTSGTTGTPKGAMHVHEAVVAHHMTGRFALDFHPQDIFWCTADPGW
ncbi:MAG: AMP-binding protein, partial [Deltaproteobacteria bacterium]